jgi:hypothetical protein
MADHLTRRETDHRDQQATLRPLDDEHPARRCIDEVIREMTDPDHRMAREVISHALRDVDASGPPYRHRPLAFATRAAVRGEQLRP